MTTGPKVLLGLLTVGVLVVSILVVGLPNPRVYLYRSPAAIESYLQKQTPLGSSESDVAAYLKSLGQLPGPATKALVPPGSEYPLSRLGGAASMHELVGEYRVIFWTSVEAFYIFDAESKLSEIRVRKTIDAP